MAMSKFLWTIATLFLSLTIQAQEGEIKTNFIVGGSVNFIHQNNTYPLSSLGINSSIGGIFSNSTNDSKNTLFSFSPYFGKEINPRFTIGGQINFAIGKYSTEANQFGQPAPVPFERNSNQIGIGLFTRHILNPEDGFNIFIQPYVEYNLLNEEQILNANPGQEEKAQFVELGTGLGILYNISDKIRATVRTGGLNYIVGNWEIVDTDTQKDFSSFGFNLNLAAVFFGIELRL